MEIVGFFGGKDEYLSAIHEIEDTTLQGTISMAISANIKSIQDIMRQDAGVDGDAQRISQLVWMIFLKVFDDKEKEWELEDENYKSAIPEKYRWRNWASNKEGITGDELLDFIE